jgi:Domain of unknown function (DUF4337)
MAVHDSVLGMFRKETKDPNAQAPEPGSRAETELKLKTRAGLIINIFALFLAVNTWYGGKLSSTIMNNTISANNQWAWYQAKNGRGVSYEIASLTAPTPALKEKFLSEKERMDNDKKEIMKKATALEAERDVAKERSPWIGFANTAYQLAIVLLSASIISVSIPLFYGSFVVAALGLLLSLQGAFLWF